MPTTPFHTDHHRIRYVLFRLGPNVVFYIHWMDERMRNEDFNLEGGADGIRVNVRSGACPEVSSLGIDYLNVYVRGNATEDDQEVATLRCDSPEQAARYIAAIHHGIVSWTEQELDFVDDTCPNPDPDGNGETPGTHIS